ncbi:ROK family protein [Leekyejoonella antrihumi]|uniref:ROK family protein n=1 Tax=Leekyejoonella antrihumi TaxID=1660198 RepID=A0A563DV37_9MICO|nr:ROK family protein [Leekyejoonella antrihumi]TWP34120.1 ROK family protein [Leekyejoonella antrihumi]
MRQSPAAVVAAVDVGGTRIKASLVDRSYTVVTQTTVATPANIREDIGQVVTSTVRSLLADAPAASLAGVGVVVPGLVDEAGGIGRLSVNLGWRDLPIRDAVAQGVDVPVVLGHDVRAGLLAESRLGAARGHANVLFMPLGTGIAGALMLDGVVIAADGWAGELGHVVIDPDGPVCPCGQRGCLEVLGSASAVERAYAAATGQSASAEEVAHRTEAGDPVAGEVWNAAVAALGRGIVATVTLTGVDRVVVGGGLAQSGEVLLAPLRADVMARLTFQRPPQIVPAALGDRAGSLGAACLVWDAL